jgi:nitrogen fixation/metabolism regulation signal transduction histidine kinase
MSVETMRKTFQKKHPSFEEIFEESTLTILEETDRLKRIVSEFSEFARMPKPSKQHCDLNEIVSSATALYKGSIAVTTNLGKSLPSIDADRDQLTQVILNLLENARDAIGEATHGEEGAIIVQTKMTASGDAVELSISDNGPGIAPDVRDKIFTPYFTTKLSKGGTGLGLATVHRIVSDHGGKLRIGQSPIGGAQFVVALPTGTTPLALTYRSVPRE